MEFLIVSALLAAAVTSGTAWVLVRRRPSGAMRSQRTIAALSFPALSILLFILATSITLIGGRQATEPGGTVGMTVFALVFFLVYALAVGAVIGVPVATLTLWWLRARR
ncbi:MAG: hypothetical protein WDN25_11410 [Acetobacteraceae bacterium]